MPLSIYIFPPIEKLNTNKKIFWLDKIFLINLNIMNSLDLKVIKKCFMELLNNIAPQKKLNSWELTILNLLQKT